MSPAPLYLSAISHTHGVARPVSRLDEAGADDPGLATDLLGTYRESTATSREMGAEVGARTLALAGVRPSVVLYATETPEGSTPSADGAFLARALAHPTALVLTVAGHDCGNLGLLLQVAQQLLNTSPAVLLITSDRAMSRRRMMSGALSVFSDGAAAVLATRGVPAAQSVVFRVHNLSVCSTVRPVVGSMDAVAQRRAEKLGRAAHITKLGRRAVAALRTASGRQPQDFKCVLFNNYRLSSQRFMAGAAGFFEHQLLPGPVAEYAHAYAADLLVNCELLSGDGSLVRGDRFAMSATGPNSWALVDVEAVAS